MIPRIFLKILIITYGVALPAYWSHKALRDSNEKETQKWLTYWIIFSLFVKILDVANYVIEIWLPFYNELVLLTLFWLLSPQLNGSKFLYNNYLKPALSNYENDIDSSMEKVWKCILDVGLRVSSKTVKFVINTTIKFLKEGNFTDFEENYALGKDENEQFGVLNVFQNILDSEGSSPNSDPINVIDGSLGDGNQLCEKESFDDVISNHPKSKYKLCKKNKTFQRRKISASEKNLRQNN
ncbi:uncharacterized protein T19C3.4 [Nephila pilipes]|uniref:Receptor expression-enhancing protein n=1 Tax=Nephila pilipes TaxID=299642 RepID=A0A8X6SZD2_NEPPI|nr:uncharacterized protein T19C3.4 [Nephila pilipes]